MKVILFKSRYWEHVVAGRKLHTIRACRRRPIRPGDELSLRGWEGKAYRSPQRLLREATCLGIREVRIDAEGIVIDDARFRLPSWLDAFAVSDGCDDWNQLRNFIALSHGLPFVGNLIQWGVHPMLAILTPDRRD